MQTQRNEYAFPLVSYASLLASMGTLVAVPVSSQMEGQNRAGQKKCTIVIDETKEQQACRKYQRKNCQTLSMKSEFPISEKAFILCIFSNKAKEF